ncbi:MAG: hypothetical protein ACQESS_02450 [Bacillota bacterium]
MLLELSTTIAVSCPACGRLGTDEINIFQLSGGTVHQLKCSSCGAKKASIRRTKKGYIQIDYFCLLCNRAHKKIVSPKKFWHSDRITPLLCEETGLNLGYFGSTEMIKSELQRQKEELDMMADELGFEDFVNPELMLEVLDYLHDIAAEGRLNCECGSHDINIELFNDRIELSCNNCGAHIDISVKTRDDLTELKKEGRVHLHSIQGKPHNSRDPWINI